MEEETPFEITDLDRREIADQIIQGNICGIIDSEEKGISVRIPWKLEAEKFEH